MEDLGVRLHDVERTTRENAVAIERAAADARAAKDEAAEFRPIVLQRSGDEQRRDKYENNVEQSFDRIRGLEQRIEPIEKWKDRATFTGVLLTALGAFVAWCVSLLKDLLK